MQRMKEGHWRSLDLDDLSGNRCNLSLDSSHICQSKVSPK